MTEIDDVVIVPTTDEHLEGYNRCVGAVALERLYIGFIAPPAIEQTREFVRSLFAGGGVQFLAVDRTGRVLGWCDIIRGRLEGFRHSGTLGMGLLAEARGQGLGRRLAETAIRAAVASGVERIQLEVFASNANAIALYERLGFVREGVKRNARLLDGRYEDNLLMALLVDSRGSWSAPQAG